MPLEDFLSGFSKSYANMRKPNKFASYKCQDTYLTEPYYKIKSIAISKKAKKESFIDAHLK